MSFPGRFEGRNVLIVGGGGSLGAAAATRLAAEGAGLLLVGLDEDKLRAAQTGCEVFGARCATAVADIGAPDDWSTVAEAIDTQLGPLHGMANFAAVLSRAGLEATDPQSWDEIVRVNLTGAWLAMRTAIPAIRSAGGGAVVNIGSIDALVGRGASTAYAASKGGLRALTKSAALQYAPEQIRVNSVHPSPMETRIARLLDTPSDDLDVDEFLSALVRDIPLGRLGAADDVAATVAFLLSDDARFITGVDLPVDGGYTAR